MLANEERIVQSAIAHRELVELALVGEISHYYYDENYLNKLSCIAKKFIRFNDATNSFINQAYSTLGLSDYKTLGVHYRGTDFRNNYDNHPKFIEKDKYFDIIDRTVKSGGYNKLFVATDDEVIVNDFRNRYSEDFLCLFGDTTRNNNNMSVLTDCRDANKYKLGLEVIRDMYILSKCEGLIAGVSNVSMASQINKIARGERYMDRIILNQGINENNHFYFPSHNKESDVKNDDAEQKRKLLQFYHVLVQWIKRNQDHDSISKYCLEHGYKRVAIYGMKELGQLLYKELISSKIDVGYAIDRDANSIVADIPVYLPTDELESVDVIIVTAIRYYKDIRDHLKERIDYPIVSLEDVVFYNSD